MTVRRTTGLVAAAALLAAAASGAHSAARLPKPRPAIEPPAAVSGWAAAAEARFGAAAAEGAARMPRPRPQEQASLSPSRTPEEEPAPPAPAVPPLPAETDSEFESCVKRLTALGAVFEKLGPIDTDGACPIARPLKLTSLGSDVAITPDTVLNCATALALAEWMKAVVIPAGLRTLGAKPESVRQDSAYVCRNRYNDPHAKISEHARANAIDIASFGFADRDSVDIGTSKPDSSEQRFETTIRAGSCRYFTTVLGPGSNAAHATHFHLDLARRKGGYRLCELGPPRIVHAGEKTTRE